MGNSFDAKAWGFGFNPEIFDVIIEAHFRSDDLHVAVPVTEEFLHDSAVRGPIVDFIMEAAELRRADG